MMCRFRGWLEIPETIIIYPEGHDYFILLIQYQSYFNRFASNELLNLYWRKLDLPKHFMTTLLSACRIKWISWSGTFTCDRGAERKHWYHFYEIIVQCNTLISELWRCWWNKACCFLQVASVYAELWAVDSYWTKWWTHWVLLTCSQDQNVDMFLSSLSRYFSGPSGSLGGIRWTKKPHATDHPPHAQCEWILVRCVKYMILQ